eukprot:6176612-Pleurochrysis_carterae.AAC.1
MRSGITRVKEAEESLERLRQFLTTLREMQAERDEVSSALQAEVKCFCAIALWFNEATCVAHYPPSYSAGAGGPGHAAGAECRDEKDEASLKKYRLKVVSACKNALLTALTKAKAEAEEAERSAASIEAQLRKTKAVSIVADEHFENVRTELGSLSSKSARRNQGAGMEEKSEEAARRRVALRDEVSAAQVAHSAASQERIMARDASHRALSKVGETKSKMEAAVDALAQA